jgi:hypothetical protein
VQDEVAEERLQNPGKGGAAFIRREPSSLLKEAVPQITRLGFLDTRNARERAKAIEREIELKNSVSIVGPALEQPFDEQEYQRAFAALAQEGAEGLVVADH